MMIDGILLVDKPKDWTSHDVCGFLRKRFGIKKVGHAGTLDPLATGLLVVLLGQATKLSNQLSAEEKEYEGVMELGIQTDSHDRQGVVLRTGNAEAITLADVREKLPQFTGEIIQVPPMVSALKHQGVRLYKLARKGMTVPREGRPVIVHRFDLKHQEGAFIHFAVSVSKGTYVRTLVNDLGESLGCYATLAELRRIRAGTFHLEKSVTIDALRSLTPYELEQHTLPLHKLR